jgi:hypothetical protein
MRYLRTDNDNCRVYYRGTTGLLFCLQKSIGKEYALYCCSRDGEPEYEVPSTEYEFETPIGDTATDKAVQAWLP